MSTNEVIGNVNIHKIKGISLILVYMQEHQMVQSLYLEDFKFAVSK